MRGQSGAIGGGMPGKRSQASFFNFNTPLFPRRKSEDQIRTERVLAEYQREHPEAEPPERELVREEMRARMRKQRAQTDAEIRGERPKR